MGKYALKAGKYADGFNAIFFRRELPMLDDAIERSKEIYSKLGATWNEQKKTWFFKYGGRLRFRPLERTSDAEKYQGQNVTDCCVEEAGNYPNAAPIDRLNGILRSVKGVPTQLILTGNPGGPGQQWIKSRYIDPAPNGMKILNRNLPNGQGHRYVFIPSKLIDNKLLSIADPGYVNRLYLVGNEKLVDAWLKGDWSAVEGAYFDEWSNKAHVIKPFIIPSEWARIVSGDWGSARPFSIGWWAVVGEDTKVREQWIPRGALIRYREWYGCKRKQGGEIDPNKGLKLTAEEVGKGIADRTPERISKAVLDPAAFAEDGGPSIAKRINDQIRFRFRPADNKRVAQRGAMGGWDQMRARIKGQDFGEPMGRRPMIYCFDTCADSIRTIPALQHDQTRAEDLDTDMEDHPADDWRYACMSKPYVIDIDKEPETQKADTYGFDESDDTWAII